MSGRLRFNCVPASVELQCGEQSYKQIIQDFGRHTLAKNHPYSRMVDRVMKRLVAGLDEKDWEVVVIDDDNTMNAFVLPGSVITGLHDDLV